MTTAGFYTSSDPSDKEDVRQEAAVDSPTFGASSSEPQPITVIQGLTVTPATTLNNFCRSPVSLVEALSTWSNGTLKDHSNRVLDAARELKEIRAQCTDHSPQKVSCSNCREAGKELNRAKLRSKGHCYAGQFQFRHRFGLVALSKIVPLDFDHVDDAEAVRDDLAGLEYCVASRVSLSGRGVHALVYADWLPAWDGLCPPEEFIAASKKTKSEDRKTAYDSAAENDPKWVRRIKTLCSAYGAAWAHAVELVRADLGLSAKADAQAKDVTRLLYDAHDDGARINGSPASMPQVVPAGNAPASQSQVDAARHALQYINPPDDTNEWMELMFQCRAAGILESDADSCSRRGSRYVEGELGPGGFLPYRTLKPRESPEEALFALEARALSQNPGFKPLEINGTRPQQGRRGRKGNLKLGAPEPSSGKAPVFAGRELDGEVAVVIDAILSRNEPPWIFSNCDGDVVVEIVGMEIRPLPREGIALLMSQCCQFLSERNNEPKPIYPPQWLTSTVAHRLPRSLPPLNGIKTAPFLFDGDLVALRDGYHSESGYYCKISDHFELGLDVGECLRRLQDLLGEFPFVGIADEANAYGLLVGQLLKSAYPSPIGFIDKPASQTGATKLATTIAALADGRLPAIMTASERSEETDKRLITHLARGPASLLIDNLSSKFASDVIASGMTANSIGGRLLGVNAEAKVPTRSLQIYMTGNNASLERDLINRSISVRLDSGVENPEERTGFRYDLPSAALERRPHFFSAAISLVARWVEVGCPMGGGPVLDSYRNWMRAVGRHS